MKLGRSYPQVSVKVKRLRRGYSNKHFNKNINELTALGRALAHNLKRVKLWDKQPN